MNCNEKGNAVSGVPDLPENNTADIKPEELPEICDRLYFRLTSTMLLSTATLVILAVGVLGIVLEFRNAGWIFVPFFILLVGIYCVSISLTQTAVSVFSKIGEIYPRIRSQTVFCNRLTSRVQCLLFLSGGFGGVILAILPIIIPLGAGLVALFILSVFAVGHDGSTLFSNFESSHSGLITGFYVGIAVLLIFTVAIIAINMYCFGVLFVVRSRLKQMIKLVVNLPRQLEKSGLNT